MGKETCFLFGFSLDQEWLCESALSLHRSYIAGTAWPWHQSQCCLGEWCQGKACDEGLPWQHWKSRSSLSQVPSIIKYKLNERHVFVLFVVCLCSRYIFIIYIRIYIYKFVEIYYACSTCQALHVFFGWPVFNSRVSFHAGLSKLDSGWTPFSFITLAFDCNLRLLSRCNCRRGYMTHHDGIHDTSWRPSIGRQMISSYQVASTDLPFRLSLCCWIGTSCFETCAPLLCGSRWTCHSLPTSQTWGAKTASHGVSWYMNHGVLRCFQGDLGL